MTWGTQLPKPLFFALYGALGCFAGAIPGEVLLLTTYKAPPPKPPPPPPMAICLLVDCSGSMKGGKLREAKSAASRFVQRQELSRNRLAIVSFESDSHRLAALSNSESTLQRAVNAISDGGSTRMDLGLAEAANCLHAAHEQQVVLLFTDGMPDNLTTTAAAATNVKSAGIRIVAVATDDADISYLTSLTGDRALVFYTSSGQYEKGFLQAEQAIFNRQLFESSGSGSYSFPEALARAAGWTTWLSLGVGIALIVAQTTLIRRRFPPVPQMLKLSAGAAGAGFLAGACGQVMYSLFAFLPSADTVARIFAWALLGSILGGGMALVIPNLQAKKGMWGGAIGAALGAVAFIVVSHVIGDLVGRLLGALLVGAALGTCVGLVEALFREAWLTVAFSPKEVTSVNLGREPVTFGSGTRCTIFVPGVAEVDVEYALNNGRLTCVETTTGRKEMPTPGAWRKIGSIAVAVNTADQKADLAALAQLWPVTPPQAERATVKAPDLPGAFRVPKENKVSLLLRLENGSEIALDVGRSIFGFDLGDTGPRAAEAVAQVQGHPAKSGVYGLLNLSSESWEAQNEAGEKLEIAKGMTIALKEGLKLNFKVALGEVRRRD